MRTRYEQASMVVGSLLLAGAGIAATGELAAQTKSSPVSDAQVESNVLKALAGTTGLADQEISSAAVYGVVTLSGKVKDESTRSLAEDIVSRTAGVQKVVDELTIGATTTPEPTVAGSDQGSNPLLQSDGTMAPGPDAQNGAQPAGAPPVSSQSQANATQQQLPPYGQQPAQPGSAQDGQAGPPPSNSAYDAGQPPYGQGGQPPYGQAGQPPYGQAGQPPYGQQGQAPYNQQGQSPYPQQGPQYGQPAPPYGQAGQSPYGQPPYGPPSQAPYGQQPPYGQQAPYGQQGAGAPGQAQPYAAGNGAYPGQPGGQVVSVTAGATLQLRLNEGIDSKHSQIGSSFSGTVIRDVVADGLVAIPRGATVQRIVVDANKGGAIKGHSTLALQLNQVILGGRMYPLASNVWEQDGVDKTGRTVGSAVGLGVVGALIGGVAGGGAGAAIGAGAGGAAGIGASAASGNQQVFLPPEAVVTFQLAQPVSITTVSQAEMERLGYGIPSGAPQQMRRRYPPPPYYYGPGYYYAPRAYYRPY